ncbi:hypothetical protein ACLK1T_29140 [Escherichia coli]
MKGTSGRRWCATWYCKNNGGETCFADAEGEDSPLLKKMLAGIMI